MHKISQAKLLFFRPLRSLAYCRELRLQDRMPLEQENLFLCLSPQELTDLEIFAPSNTRTTFKIAKCTVICLNINSYIYVS